MFRPRAPTIEIADEISINVELFHGSNDFGSAPGKHFLQNQVSGADTRWSFGNPHVPMVGVTKTETSWPAPRPMPLQRRIPPRPSIIRNVSGSAVHNRDPPKCDFFPKAGSATTPATHAVSPPDVDRLNVSRDQRSEIAAAPLEIFPGKNFQIFSA
jgi:hypothetical protein